MLFFQKDKSGNAAEVLPPDDTDIIYMGGMKYLSDAFDLHMFIACAEMWK